MKAKVWLFLGLGLAVLVFAFAITLNLLPGKAPTNEALSSPTQGTPTPGAVSSAAGSSTAAPSSAKAGAAPTKSATSTPAAGPEPAPEQEPPAAPAPEPEAPAEQKGPAASPDPARPLEVNTPAPEATQRVLPASKPQTALVNAPLPQQADAVGALVNGYPDEALPALDGSKINTSSVSPDGNILHTSLVAGTANDPAAVQAFYQQQLAPLGFGMAEAPAPAGATAMWFTRGDDKVTLTVTPVEGGSTYIVYGVLHTGE